MEQGNHWRAGGVRRAPAIGAPAMLLAFLLVACGGFPGGSSSQVGTNPTDNIPFPARGYTGPMVGLFFPVDASNAYVATLAAGAADDADRYGLKMVNLIVEWKQLEPTAGNYRFEHLESAVREIKRRGLACVARIYANKGPWPPAYPDYLGGYLTDYYVSVPQGGGPGGFRQPMPSDPAYRAALQSLLSAVYTWFSRPTAAAPDLWQIIAGGEYGEMVLASHPQVGTLDLTPVFAAESDHSQWHAEAKPSGSDLVLMVNSLYPSNPSIEDTVPDAAYAAGVRAAQSNAGIINLASADYGPGNLRMFARLSQKGYTLFLEDESGGSQFNRPVSDRLSLLIAKEQDFGIRFRIVTIWQGDLIPSNIAAIRNLVAHVKGM